jgi:hypothetical protein
LTVNGFLETRVPYFSPVIYPIPDSFKLHLFGGFQPASAENVEL